MQLVMFVGLQGSGKSTFYQRSFADTHIRLNLDMLRTRYREKLLLDACLAAKQPVVIDNTNPTPQERARYISQAREHGFAVIGYYFQSRLEDCKQRNACRPADQSIPLAGLLGTYARLVVPTLSEGFDVLHYVSIDESSQFMVQEWSDEIR